MPAAGRGRPSWRAAGAGSSLACARREPAHRRSYSRLAHLHGLQQEAIAHEALLRVLAEKHLLAVHQMDGAVGAVFAVGDEVVDAVVEDHTVLEHLHNCAALWRAAAISTSCEIWSSTSMLRAKKLPRAPNTSSAGMNGSSVVP